MKINSRHCKINSNNYVILQTKKNIEGEFIKYLRNEQIITTQNITNVNVNINMGHYWEISKILNDHLGLLQ